MDDVLATLAPLTRAEVIANYSHRERMNMLRRVGEIQMSVVTSKNPSDYGGGFLHNPLYVEAAKAAHKLRQG